MTCTSRTIHPMTTRNRQVEVSFENDPTKLNSNLRYLQTHEAEQGGPRRTVTRKVGVMCEGTALQLEEHNSKRSTTAAGQDKSKVDSAAAVKETESAGGGVVLGKRGMRWLAALIVAVGLLWSQELRHFRPWIGLAVRGDNAQQGPWQVSVLCSMWLWAAIDSVGDVGNPVKRTCSKVRG